MVPYLAANSELPVTKVLAATPEVLLLDYIEGRDPIGRSAEQDAAERLAALSGKEIKLRVQVDPGILGGIVARIGSTVWDASLRNSLVQIHQSIAKG